MLLVQLANLPGGPYPFDVHLVEPRPAPGPGLAYSARRQEYLLNVRTTALSAFPNQPDHFARWVAATDSPPCEQQFCSRQVYGRYLQELVSTVLTQPATNGLRFFWHQDSAVAATLTPDGRAATVRLASGTALPSDQVVLALGNFPPLPPAGPDQAYLTHSTYHGNPWAPGALRNIAPQDSVLLIGSGLTAVDVLLGLDADGHTGPVTVVSRNGRWPAEHGPAGLSYPNFYAADLAGMSTVGEVLRAVRHRIREAAAQGIDWRPVLDSLRPSLGKIWAAWPLAEQARFLRHLASIWSVVRHRSPPQNTAAVQGMLDAGIVRMQLGRVRQTVPQGPDLAVQVQQQGQARWLTARHVISCTGPLLDYGRIDSALVTSLREAGLLVPDALRLGMQTNAHGALMDARGQASGVLFTLGPSRRPAYFESTAVPELRQQAAALAQHLAGDWVVE
ncbi:FAD/NAD(P)-binding protein [Hymenobacter fastidiosus]|uniref:FAD/NAD(P)-binding protein n=2 Tax=Hymenobacter fastidiosus TaxID=486264 RepID=A0ABP7S2F9_9BACT